MFRIKLSILSTFCAVICLILPHVTWANIVKKSKSGICHTSQSQHYDHTKNFTSYQSLSACIDAGGRLPKNQQVIGYDKKSSAKYSRKQFGNGWADLNKNCRNSRHEALIAQSVAPVRFKTQKHCKVVAGRWNSMFTGQTIYNASDIDIDHVVPLSWAWKNGAQSWTKQQRIKFANDPINLLSVEASLNRQKGDKGPLNWLPPKNQCQYILRFERVLRTYKLSYAGNNKSKFVSLKKRYCGS